LEVREKDSVRPKTGRFVKTSSNDRAAGERSGGERSSGESVQKDALKVKDRAVMRTKSSDVGARGGE